MIEHNSQNEQLKENGILLVAGYWENELIEELSQSLSCSVSILEPDPHQYLEKSRNQSNQNCYFYNWTLHSINGISNFYLFKPARLSSTMKPKGLARIYRNYNASKLDGVETKTLSDCCENLNITNERPNGLLLGMNASLDFILSEETTEQALKNFSLVRIRIANKDLYETETKVASVVDSLQSQNFKLIKKFSPDVLFSEYIFEQDLQAVIIERQNAILAAKEIENTELKCSLNEMQKRCLSQEKIIEENKILSERLTETEHLLVTSKNNLSLLESALSEKERLHNEVSEQSIKFKQTADILKDEKSNLQEKLEQGELQHINDAKRIDELKLSNIRINEESIAAQNEVKNLTSQLQQKEPQLVNLQEELKQAELQHSNDAKIIKELRLTKNTINEDKVVAQNKVGSLNTQLQQKEQQLTNLRNQVEESTQKLNSLKEQKTKMQAGVQKLETELSELKIRISNENNIKSTLETQNKELQSQLKELKQTNEKLKQKAEKQKFAQDKVEFELVKYEAQLELVKDVIIREKSF